MKKVSKPSSPGLSSPKSGFSTPKSRSTASTSASESGSETEPSSDPTTEKSTAEPSRRAGTPHSEREEVPQDPKRKTYSPLEKTLIFLNLALFLALVVVMVMFSLHVNNDSNKVCDSGSGSNSGSGNDSDHSSMETIIDSSTYHKAICVMKKQDFNNVTGTITFFQKPGQDLKISVGLFGVPLGENGNTKHGFYVHHYGDISTCAATGGHYNPDRVEHAGPHDAVRHEGDFGNLEQDGSGNIVTTFKDPWASLFGGKSIIGRALVLHAGQDDLGHGTGDKEKESQVSGNAGSRLACCVIGRQNPNQ